jgi:hypothetical protein
MNLSSLLVLTAHAFVVWALCFATIGIGMKVTTERRAQRWQRHAW